MLWTTEGEGLALEILDWTNLHQRIVNFRNAIVNVALERPLPSGHPPAAPPRWRWLRPHLGRKT